jgi:hypothetical protein
MNKTCTICKEVKELTEYNKKNTSKDGLQNICRECNRVRSRTYYKTNNEQHRKNVKIRTKNQIKEYKEKVNKIKSAYGCQLCFESDVVCLDFHHLDDKDFTVASGVYCRTWEKIKKEICKCVVLCANCHRKLHAGKKVVGKEMLCVID